MSDDLRPVRTPFGPALDSEIDASFYDNIFSPENLAKYTEVKEKQANVDHVCEKEEPFGRDV